MATETFINVGETTLAVAATNVATTFTLASGAPFNVTGQFRLRLDDSLQQANGVATRYELCRATFNAGNVVNAFRSGADLEGTTAQAWPIGTKVVAIATAAALTNMAAMVVAGTTGAMSGGTPPAGTKFLIQGGDNLQTTSVNGVFSINYPTPFPGGVITASVVIDDQGASPMILTVAETLSTSSYLQGYVRNGAGAPWISTPVRIHWLALGW